MKKLVAEHGLQDVVVVASAGTSDYHAGEPPDNRARVAASKRGVSVDGEARQFLPEDFDVFDYVLAMDVENLRDLQRIARHEADRAKLSLLLDFDPALRKGCSVPDPYYGGAAGFDQVLDMCERACRNLLAHVRERMGA
jgi:protein-tyrosine phosphatase